MNDNEIKLIIGALLHDIGKVVYRSGRDNSNHSKSGAEFLTTEIGLTDNAIINSLRYHHSNYLKNANIENDDLAYIVYIADNIASAVDRRENEEEQSGFDRNMPLESVFNLIGEKNVKMHYEPKTLDNMDKINYPTDEVLKFDRSFYEKIIDNIKDSLKGINFDIEYINSLLSVLEGNLSYVPSSTNKGEIADISLYDHVKVTAALASCIYEYLIDSGNNDYKEILFKKANTFYEKNTFIMYSMNLSGIQKFIYTINSKKALKTLRARSFYLEIMMENIIDNLLEKVHLSRANLIYNGGGHCYILLPNTAGTKNILAEYNKSINNWLLENLGTALYVTDGYCECSANMLKNNPNGSYSKIYDEINKQIQNSKHSKYNAKQIMYLNKKKIADYTRECSICKTSAKLNVENKCPMCQAIENFSNNILCDDYFTVTYKKSENYLPLPGDMYLKSDSSSSLRKAMDKDDYYIRAYSKNHYVTGVHVENKLWVGDYTSGRTFEEMAKESQGIDRIGVFRADVDNLGYLFLEGFDEKYKTLSRSATLSRHLSLFFKLYINQIFEEPVYSMGGIKKEKRNATICYSGGDDIFIVGAWDDIVEIAVDIKNSFERYVQGKLTISGGVGLYTDSYPISVSAREVGHLEEKSKHFPGKNAITLFEDGSYHMENGERISDGTYSYPVFIDKVVGEKLSALIEYFDRTNERGINFLYNLLDLLRRQDDKINFARYVYILSRLEPNAEAGKEEKELYALFSKRMYKWAVSDDKADIRQLKSAMTIYSYLRRKEENK